MKILLCGHACGPNLGSEPGFTWNWATHLARRHQVWVITFPTYRNEIEQDLQRSPHPNLTFEFVSLPRHLEPWHPGAGEKWLRLHYILWQHVALQAARELHSRIDFDVSHHVSWGTVGAAPLLWKLPIPFFWGPIGGAQVAPRKFTKYFGRQRTTEMMRTARVRMSSINPFLKKAARRCALILTTNNETKLAVEAAGAKNVRLFLDGGVAEEWLIDQKEKPQDKTFVLHWCGRLEPRKGLAIAIESLAAAGDIDIRLEVTGRGPEQHRCASLARRLGIERKVEFLGFIPHEEVRRRLRQSDVLLVTSLRDSFGSIALEAASQGLPIIALDHQGIGALLPPDAGWKVPVTSPEETVRALASAIRAAASDPHARGERSRAALRFASRNTWEARALQMENWYEQYR